MEIVSKHNFSHGRIHHFGIMANLVSSEVFGIPMLK